MILQSWGLRKISWTQDLFTAELRFAGAWTLEGGRLEILFPLSENLRQQALQEFHDKTYFGHMGYQKTQEVVLPRC